MTAKEIHPRIANPFDIEARDLDVVRRILSDWLGAELAQRVMVIPVMEGEAVYEDAPELP